MSKNLNIEMIEDVAKALGELKDKVIFVGGATVSVYLNLEVAEEIRPTEDVDVIIEITSQGDYQLLSEKLIQMKFSPDTSKGAPICRWKYLGLTIDIMPLDESILGFSNRFYKDGIKKAEVFKISNETSIKVLPLDLFLATKLEAFFSRGFKDPRFSSDLEDIVAILIDAKDFDAILRTKNEIKFLCESFKKLMNNPNCVEAIKGFIQGPVEEQFEIICKRIGKIQSI